MDFLDRVISNLRGTIRSVGEVAGGRNARFQNLSKPNVTDAGPFEPADSVNGGTTANAM